MIGEIRSEEILGQARRILEGNGEKAEIGLMSLSFMGYNIFILNFHKISSTMLLSQNWPQSLAPPNTSYIFTANHQLNGRGQKQNSWHSPPGNIYCTLLTNQPLSVLSHVLPVTTLSIAEAVEETLDLDEEVLIKWQNDLVIAGRKFSGTLIKSDVEADRVILQVGVGVNVNEDNGEGTTCLREHCLGIKQQALSYLEDEDIDSQQIKHPKYPPKSQISSQTLTHIIKKLSTKILANLTNLSNPLQSHPLQSSLLQSQITTKYNNRLIWKNQPVKIYDAELKKVMKCGVFRGVDLNLFALVEVKGGGGDGEVVKVCDGRMRKD